MKGVSIPGFKLSKDGKRVEPDFAARDAKLDVSTRLQKRKSRKITVSRNPRLREG